METARTFGRLIPTARSVLKEKLILGNIMGGPYSRLMKGVFQKLILEQRGIIRSVMHGELRKCLAKGKDAQYTTVNSIHAAIMKRNELPKWSRATTHKILHQMKLVCLENRDIHFGLLIENDFLTGTRIKTTQLIKKLLSEGYYLMFFDESHVNVHYRQKRIWQDTTFHTTKEALDKEYTSGVEKPPG